MRTAIESLTGSVTDFLKDSLPSQDLGASIRVMDTRTADLTFDCFRLARMLEHEQKEGEIAEWLASNLHVDPQVFSRVTTVGPYVNFFLNRERFMARVLGEIHDQQEHYGEVDVGKGALQVFDFSSPNIGKPLHVGHIRSTIVGDSMMRILRKAGYRTHGINYLGDIGLHLDKVIVEYMRGGNYEALQSNPEQELLRLYVNFGKRNTEMMKERSETLETLLQGNPETEELDRFESPAMLEAKEVHRRLEAQDPEVVKILEIIREASLRGFDRIYGLLGISFDETTGQSRFSERGKQFVEKALADGLAERLEDGAVVVSVLRNYGLPPKIILKSDGTAIYSTQDLGAAIYRHETYGFARLVYAVAEEQATYFRQIFKILELAGFDWAKDCYHLSFGMINLKDAKMSSREGNVIFLEEVLSRAIERASLIIEELNPNLPDKEKVAQMVGIGAMKYMVLGVSPAKAIEFSWDKALNMTANSGPYIQYNYARANALLREIGNPGAFNPNQLGHNLEFELAKTLARYSLAVQSAALTMRPNLIADYSNSVAKAFSRFYDRVRVKGSSEEQARLYLTGCAATVLKDSLGLLGISVPDRM